MQPFEKVWCLCRNDDDKKVYKVSPYCVFAINDKADICVPWHSLPISIDTSREKLSPSGAEMWVSEVLDDENYLADEAEVFRLDDIFPHYGTALANITVSGGVKAMEKDGYKVDEFTEYGYLEVVVSPAENTLLPVLVRSDDLPLLKKGRLDFIDCNE